MRWFVKRIRGAQEHVVGFANDHNLKPGELLVISSDPGEYSRFGGGREASVLLMYYAEKELES